MNHLVIGQGEVGTAIARILRTTSVVDKNKGIEYNGSFVDAMHICFPYEQGTFEQEVQKYKDKFRPNIIIIHSSVPIGTSEKLGAVHSPVRGVHPHLEKGIRTFVKYFGGFQAHAAAAMFSQHSIRTKVVRKSQTTEALKLWDTTQYGIMILIEKEMHDFCIRNGVDFETVYAEANETYNEGYSELGMEYVMRPALMHKDGPIGGHCVVENAALLDSPLAKLILDRNAQLRKDSE